MGKYKVSDMAIKTNNELYAIHDLLPNFPSHFSLLRHNSEQLFSNVLARFPIYH